MVAHRGAGVMTGTPKEVASAGSEDWAGGVCRCIHSRHAATTIELTGIPVRAEAWSSRAKISSVNRTVVALAKTAIRYHFDVIVNWSRGLKLRIRSCAMPARPAIHIPIGT